jgi:hypothetical protein
VALFGRKINNAENQLAFIHFLRLIADGEVGPEEAAKAYHGVLQHLGVKPHRSLEDDMKLQTNVMSYGGSSTTISVPAGTNGQAVGTSRGGSPVGAALRGGPEKACACECASKNGATEAKGSANGAVDFAKLTPAQKIAYHKAKWDRILG